MQNLTLKARMYVLGLIAVGGIVLAGGFGIVSLSAFNAKLEKDLADVRHGVHTLVGIQSAMRFPRFFVCQRVDFMLPVFPDVAC